MPSYFLLTLTFVLVALFATQQVSAVAAQDRQGCINNAYKHYDRRTKSGCRVEQGEKYCKFVFDFAIKMLNQELDECGRSDYATLCRVVPSGGFLSFSHCWTLNGGSHWTKAQCEAEASKDYMFYGADGSTRLYKAKDAKCINDSNYDCKNLC